MERPTIYQDARLTSNPENNILQKIGKALDLDSQYKPEQVYKHSSAYLHSRNIKRKIHSLARENKKYQDIPTENLAEKMANLHLDHASKEKLDNALPEVFAAATKAMQEILGMTPFDTQTKAAIALHDGKVVEMATGEGKTLAIALTAALNGLSRDGVHVPTSTNTLAKRDLSLLGPVYKKLGLSASVILDARDSNGQKVQYIYDPSTPGEDPDYPHLRKITRKEAYQTDITYGIDKAFIFDNLEDEILADPNDRVQRQLNLSLVDEIDNNLIDKALTPNILTMPATESDDIQITQVQNLITKLNLQPPKYEGEEDKKKLISGDFQYLNEYADTGSRIMLTDKAYDRLNKLLNFQYIDESGKPFKPDNPAQSDLYDDPRNTPLIQRIQASLQANFIFKKGIHYFVEGDKIVLIDQVTGVRTPDKHFDERIHQAIQAKEGVPITQDVDLSNSASTQTYYKKYKRLAGPTGTAVSSAKAFKEAYGMDIVSIPSRLTSKRQYISTVGFFENKEDTTTKDGEIKEGKFTEAIKSALLRREDGQPIILYTSSVIDADRIKELMLPYLANEFNKNAKGEWILYQPEVLHAQQDKKEADVISLAGQRISILEGGVEKKKGQITIVTGIAGRGSDIVLGGPKPTDANGKLLPEDSQEYIAWKKEHDEINEAGGLHITLTEMPPLKRVFLQIIGRAARQGDQGSFEVFVSQDDRILTGTNYDLRQKLKEEWAISKEPPGSPRYQIKLNGFLEEIQNWVEQENSNQLFLSSQYSVAMEHTKEKLRRFGERIQDPNEAHAKILESIDFVMTNAAGDIHAIDTEIASPEEKDKKIKEVLGNYLDFSEDEEGYEEIMDIIRTGEKVQIKNILLNEAHAIYDSKLSQLENDTQRQEWEKNLCLRGIPNLYKDAVRDITEKLMQFQGIQIQRPIDEFNLAVSNYERQMDKDYEKGLAYSALKS